jgi:indolepyruvate ferredoxin oxidoreductase beta subunit
VSGFLRLWLLARLKRWRPRGYRFAEEQALIERWLDAICRAQAIDGAFAREIVLCARLLKGYGDTHRHGRRSFLAVLDEIIEPALRQAQAAGEAVRRARKAALADPDGAALIKTLAAPADNNEIGRAAAE